MTEGIVFVHFCRLGGRLLAHQKAMLAADAKAIAQIKGFEFGGTYNENTGHAARIYLVPEDTLLVDEARNLGIVSQEDFYGGVVPYPFVSTKAITHELITRDAARPEGWSSSFVEQVRDVVLPGYTVFSKKDARAAAGRMFQGGDIRMKPTLVADGRGQTVVTNGDDLELFLEYLTDEDVANFGIVLEEPLWKVTTRSVGQIVIDGFTVSYHGTQRRTVDNEGQRIYGGSDLICARGGWNALQAITSSHDVEVAITQARVYDEAMSAYPGFMASRRNYDVAQGIDRAGKFHSGVLESSWRAGGATGAEVVALRRLRDEPSLQTIEVAHIEEFGENVTAPAGAVVQYEGTDPNAGPVLRYTIIKDAIA